jgi:hypothetical protein
MLHDQKELDKVRDAIAETLGEAYDCTRVWSAWSYGTMSQDDFVMVASDEERLDELVSDALAAAQGIIDAAYERGVTAGFDEAIHEVKRGEIDPQTYQRKTQRIRTLK